MPTGSLPFDSQEPRSKLPRDFSPASQLRYEVACALVASSPPSFGHEAILSGSAARGVADEASDIEMVFYVDELPSSTEREKWLWQVGATDFTLGIKSIGDEQIWMTFFFRDIWVEACWQVTAAHSQKLDALIAGTVAAPSALRLGWIMQNALSLRGGSLLHQWQYKLQQYPDVLPPAILSSALHYQRFSYFLELPWALIRRNEQFALVENLYVEVFNLLRILFAVNHQWEPDVKWLQAEAHRLKDAPECLLERIEAIFTVMPLEERVTLYLLLLRDVLALVALRYDVAEALLQVQERLHAHNING
ncbi:MAG: hypothetical protein J2P37_06230 [Ktedonobacteraceae bacterium]|nr:hypothetical protein [Ktedonobacteraceae bacterium]